MSKVFTTLTSIHTLCGHAWTEQNIFTSEDRKNSKLKADNLPGSVHHIAIWVSQSTIRIAEKNLNDNNISNTGIKDRGFMDSLYFKDPLGLLVELANYKFEPPQGKSYADVLSSAHSLRVKRKAINIEDQDIALAIKNLS